MKIDYLILFEHKARELENACLIKYMLEERGYRVKIASIYSLVHHFLNPKVIIVPHLYNDYQVYAFISKYKNRTCKVINLQYEQVLSKEDELSGYGIPTGEASKGIVFAWGRHEKERYKNNMFQKVVITGNIAMDFNSSKFNNYFIKRENLLNKYSISNKEKVMLFISSFSLANVSDDYIKEHFSDTYESVKVFADISKISKEIVIDWLDKYSNSNKVTVIYRPHPAEMSDDLLYKITQRNSRFKVICDYSVRQWIQSCDYLVSWFSTSIVDAYYARKNCLILRPIMIPKEIDVPLYINADSISTYEEFLHQMNEASNTFPIEKTKIEEYYSNMIEKLCTPSFIDKCEEIYHNYPSQVFKANIIRGKNKKWKTLVKDFTYEIYKYLNLSWLLSLIYKNKNLKKRRALSIQKELFRVKELERDYCRRLRNNV